jgi:hypothetical protein
MDTTQNTPQSPAAPATQPPVLSSRRLAARRANAQKCTGPRTPEGKSVASLNALKHGFFSSDVVNPVLDGPARAEEFNSILDALLDDFEPQSACERLLVDEVAACCWRIRRLLRYECRESWSDEDNYRRWANTEKPSDSILASMGNDTFGIRRGKAETLRRSGLDSLTLPGDSDIDKIVRYERLIKRNLYRALYTLERMRAARIRPDPSDSTSLPADLNEKQF